MNNFEKYKFKKYDSKYKKQFYYEKKRLLKIIPKSQIEHVGSSAVINLGGKGVIDIGIEVKKSEISKVKRKLEKNNYLFKSTGGTKERLFFNRLIKYNKKTRLVHIQLTFDNNKSWKNLIALRDYLNKNKQTREQYSKIKKEGSRLAKGEGKIYRKYKKEFLDKITVKALKEFEKK